MSDPTTTAPAILDSALKAAVVTAAENHLATVTADVQRVKAAVTADLPSVIATGASIEAIVKAEVAKLKTDVGSVWKPWMTYAAIAVASAGVVVAAHVSHLF